MDTATGAVADQIRDVNNYGLELPIDPFLDNYIAFLREDLKGKNFTFKTHWTEIKNWEAARDLISEWNPEIIGCWRSDVRKTVLSALLAEKDGFVSRGFKNCSSFEVSEDDFLRIWRIVVDDWYAGLIFYKPKKIYEYNEILTEVFNNKGRNWGDFQHFLKECHLKDQRSHARLFKILNLEQVEDWIRQNSFGEEEDLTV
jgi:hypothetical protein